MNNNQMGGQLGAKLGGCLWGLYPERIDINNNNNYGVGGNRGSPNFTWPSDRASSAEEEEERKEGRKNEENKRACLLVARPSPRPKP